MTKATQPARRGRPATFAEAQAKVAALIAFRDGGETPSRFLTLQLVEAEMLKPVQAAPNGKRGRPAVSYEVTGKAKSWIALIQRNAAKAAAKAAAAEQAAA